jgi:hypothetical protein
MNSLDRGKNPDNRAEQLAAPIAELATNVDPAPHFIMSLACKIFSFKPV